MDEILNLDELDTVEYPWGLETIIEVSDEQYSSESPMGFPYNEKTLEVINNISQIQPDISEVLSNCQFRENENRTPEVKVQDSEEFTDDKFQKDTTNREEENISINKNRGPNEMEDEKFSEKSDYSMELTYKYFPDKPINNNLVIEDELEEHSEKKLHVNGNLADQKGGKDYFTDIQVKENTGKIPAPQPNNSVKSSDEKHQKEHVARDENGMFVNGNMNTIIEKEESASNKKLQTQIDKREYFKEGQFEEIIFDISQVKSEEVEDLTDEQFEEIIFAISQVKSEEVEDLTDDQLQIIFNQINKNRSVVSEKLTVEHIQANSPDSKEDCDFAFEDKYTGEEKYKISTIKNLENKSEKNDDSTHKFVQENPMYGEESFNKLLKDTPVQTEKPVAEQTEEIHQEIKGENY